MNLDEFWGLIHESGNGEDPDEVVENLTEKLGELPPEKLEDFERHMAKLMEQSYTWKLWGAAYLINGGCSDDGFDYFRGWLVAQGRTVFEKALSDPDSLVDAPFVEMDVECEEILYLANSAYQEATGNELEITQEYPGLGEDWDFDDDEEMQNRYPKLYAKFCEE